MTKEERIKQCKLYLEWGKNRVPQNEDEAKSIKEHNDFWGEELNIVNSVYGAEASSTRFIVSKCIYS